MKNIKARNLTPIYVQFRSKKLNIRNISKKEYVESNVRELFKHWLSQAVIWGAGFFILLSVLDYFSTPENFSTFFLYRISIALVLIAIFVLTQQAKISRFIFYQALFYIALIGSGITIELMIIKFGGHASPYYPGMIILGILAISFIPAGFSFHLLSALIIYLIYLIPILVLENITNFQEFFIANVFLVSILISVLALRCSTQRNLFNELSLKYDLERRQDKLQEAVQKRTDELSETIQKLLNSRKRLKDKVDELESFYEMAVGRELKMKKLKDEIGELKEELFESKNSSEQQV